jgi:hypothetical protein
MINFSESNAEELAKKIKFFEESHTRLSSTELNQFNNLNRQFRSRISKVWALKRQIEQIEGQREILKKEQKKTFAFFMIAAALLLLIKLYQSSDLNDSMRLLKIELEFSFIFLAGFIYYLWISALNKISDQNMSQNISNTNMAASLIEVPYTDLNLMNFPNFAEYMKIYDEDRYGRELTAEGQYVVKDFNIQMGLAVLESMGHEIPLIWR